MNLSIFQAMITGLVNKGLPTNWCLEMMARAMKWSITIFSLVLTSSWLILESNILETLTMSLS
jgi:hypothetical protein